MYFLVDRDMQIAEDRQEVVSDETMHRWATQYRELTTFCFNALKEIDSIAHKVEYEEIRYYAIQGATRVSQMYYAAGRYDTSIAVLQDLQNLVSMNQSQRAVTAVNLGEAYQAEGQWENAFASYRVALSLKPIPLDDSGNVLLQLFNLPAYMFSFYDQVVGDTVLTRTQYHEAESYYLDLAAMSQHRHLVALSRAALARLYDGVAEWEKVVDQLTQMTADSQDRMIELQIAIADIYNDKLNQPDRAMHIYDSILTSLKPEDSLARPYIQFKTTSIMMNGRRFMEARNILTTIKKNNPRFFDMTPAAQLAMARTFELENNWDRAVTEYRSLIENYRGSDEAMQGYVHVAATLDSMNRTKEAASWYKDADEYINEIATRNRGSLTEARALYFKSLLYEQQRRWEDAAAVLMQLFDKFPDSDAGRQSIVRAGTIYAERLGNQAKSDSLFNVFKNSLSHVKPGWENSDQTVP